MNSCSGKLTKKQQKEICHIRQGDILLFIFQPYTGGNCQQQGKDLQSAQQHGKAEHKFAEWGIVGVAEGGTDGTQAGAHVVKAGNGGTKMSLQTHRFPADGKENGKKADHVQGKVIFYIAQRAAVQTLTFKLDCAHRTGVEQLAKFPLNGFKQNDHTTDLQTAGSAARTAADKHKQQQDHFGEGGPEIKIGGGVTGGGYNRRYLEGTVPQCGEKIAEQRENVGSDQHGGNSHNT